MLVSVPKNIDSWESPKNLWLDINDLNHFNYEVTLSPGQVCSETWDWHITIQWEKWWQSREIHIIYPADDSSQYNIKIWDTTHNIKKESQEDKIMRAVLKKWGLDIPIIYLPTSDGWEISPHAQINRFMSK